MIEHEHSEICQADIEERKFAEECRQLLTEAGFHPISTQPLPIASPRKQPLYQLEYDSRTGEYTPVPITPQHERGDQR